MPVNFVPEPEQQRSRGARIARLRQRLADGPMRPETLAGIMRQMLDLLEEHDEYHRTREAKR